MKKLDRVLQMYLLDNDVDVEDALDATDELLSKGRVTVTVPNSAKDFVKQLKLVTVTKQLKTKVNGDKVTITK